MGARARRGEAGTDDGGRAVSEYPYQVMPDMPAEQFEALKADIAARGVLTPIELDETGAILDGHHRKRACDELGITDYPTVIRPGLSEQEKRTLARKANMMRRHLSRAQMQAIVAAQLKDTPRWANNRIALELGVSDNTVRRIRASLEATSQIAKLTKLEGADGKARGGRRPAIMVTDEGQRGEVLAALAAHPGAALPDRTFDFSSLRAAFAEMQSPTAAAWDALSDQDQQDLEDYEKQLIADGADPEDAHQHIEWLARIGWTVAAWTSPEGEAWCRAHRFKQKPVPFRRPAAAPEEAAP